MNGVQTNYTLECVKHKQIRCIKKDIKANNISQTNIIHKKLHNIININTIYQERRKKV